MSRVMRTPEQRIRQRSAWFAEAERVGSVTVACRRRGISRKTYDTWRRRFAESRGARQALRDRSRRPHRPRRQVTNALRRLRRVRQQTRLGPARLRALLLAAHGRHVPSTATMAKILRQAGLTRRRRATPKRSRRTFVVPRPGDLVPLPLDVQCVPYLVESRRLSQDTAIDCCTRLRVVSFSEEMTNSTAKAFVQFALSTLPFPVRMVQTDNDSPVTH